MYVRNSGKGLKAKKLEKEASVSISMVNSLVGK